MQDIEPLSALDSNAERRVLVEKVRSIGHTTVGAYFHALAGVLSERAAVTRLIDGEVEGATMTFAEMDREARSLAAYFQSQKAKGDRAMMLFDAGAEVMQSFLGCAYAGVIAVPMPAPLTGKVERYLNRVKGVVMDCDIRFILTTTPILNTLRDVAKTIDGLADAEWIAVDALADRSDAWVKPKQEAEDIAYLQYTSGSTSTPKGVMVTHRNLMKIIEYNGIASGCPTVGTKAVCWMPYFHDFGLIDGLLVPLAFGMPVYAMTPFEFVKNPARWVNAIHRYRASHSSAPNFAFDLVARKTTAEQRRHLDLSCWRRANNAAEPIRNTSVNRFLETFEPCGFARDAMAPSWGLAEATLLVTLADAGPKYYSLDAASLQHHRVRPASEGQTTIVMMGCGRIWPGPWEIDVKIVDPDTFELSPSGETGEIWVAGDLVAKGYWKRPSDTAEKFHAEIKGFPGTCYMRSGDLGFMDGDELVFTGRSKDLIIIEGRNHYPQEIEKTAEASHPALRPGCTIAFSVDADDKSRLIVVSEIVSKYGLSDVISDDSQAMSISRRDLERAIRSGVADEHQIRVHEIVFIPSGHIPKTTSGKLQRKLCREKYVSQSLHALGT
ncbi:fatty acyl-AMP ligase [Oleiagrimonas citrea]|uniref:Fatty acyl-AMP ligase n=1 Tax=Oleiagrimonas citrea TaxID=1665687 RepID=A0A846ZS17_9GAMM|nr:fatty acyl-AMP ligase [Oleiagrimonas citrea]NKZ40171.1 fatty acyl-AMP ligase [Oleiagrimonas citrea]